MPTVDFTIGPKDYTLACQEGEERLLRRAAAMLDAEAQSILERVGRMPEQRLLLLAGLMLADRAQAIEDRAAATERELTRLRTNPPRAEAPAVPQGAARALADLAARAEALADRAEQALDAPTEGTGQGG